MTQKQAIDYWKLSAVDNSRAAKDVYKANHPEWSFFLWHLSLEKSLKGLIVKKEKIPPPTHNLVNLAKIAGISIDEDKKGKLLEINTYNIEARYDDYKRKFYKKVRGKIYAEKWQRICNEFYVWLINQF